MKRVHDYRKIYEEYFGPIPKDKSGRSYEVHHIDGNHNNNDIINLKLVTIQEHYDIHHSQQDWGACHAIAMRMKRDPEVISNLARQHALDRVANGSHPFSGPDNNNKRVANGTHPAALRIKNGTHNFLGKNHPMKIASANGTHHFKNKNFINEWKQNNPKKYEEVCKKHSENALKRVADGNHSGTKVFATSHICPHCGKHGKGAIMYRFHYDNCKIVNTLTVPLWS